MDFGAAGGVGAAPAQNAQSAGAGSPFDFGGANNQGTSSASAGMSGDPFSGQGSGQAGATASTGAQSAAEAVQPKFQPNPFQTMAP
jgi:hypothetical protein